MAYLLDSDWWTDISNTQCFFTCGCIMCGKKKNVWAVGGEN